MDSVYKLYIYKHCFYAEEHRNVLSSTVSENILDKAKKLCMNVVSKGTHDQNLH